MQAKTFAQLKKNLKQPPAEAKPIRAALLGDTATQFLGQALRGTGLDHGFNLEMWEADFDQVERQALDPGSELHAFRPEVVIVFLSAHKLLGKYNGTDRELRSNFSASQLAFIRQIHDSIRDASGAKVIFYNFPEIDDAVFGSHANKVESSFPFQLRKLNHELMALAATTPSLYLCDLSSIQNRLGRNAMFQPSIYVNAEMVLSIDALPEVAARTFELVAAMHGKVRKCVVLDLDDTLWGGVIGDDGIENIQLGHLGIGKAFTEFQYWLKKLRERGIVLAVCSKNTQSVAQEVFEKHPDMVLRLEDIAVFVANWDNKVDNIRRIQETLNIGFDSMVFIDDNPFERNMVRENIPGIAVPEMPQDPANYLEYLYALNLFETASFSEEDVERTRQYRVEAQRQQVREKFANEDEYLRSLEMLSRVEVFNKFNTPRVAQLSQRSNQFNLRTVRYTESDIARIAGSSTHVGISFGLEDKFGDHGIICATILEHKDDAAFIDTWFMSCRVLKRTLENFVLNTLVERAKEAGCARLVGEYVPTAKNEMVRDHYPNLGFQTANGHWVLDVANYKARESFIKTRAA
jgi:FkbH-like protein